jgi:hypothetical protein
MITIRELKTKDIFLISKIAKKIEIHKLIKIPNIEEMQEIDKENAKKQIGIDLFLLVFENIYLAEKEVMELISNLTGLNNIEIDALSFKELKEIISSIFKSEELVSFLS